MHDTRIWFHGTRTKQIADEIMRDGFNAGTYFAGHLEDAIEFGGPYVFEVALDERPVFKENWQMHVPVHIGPEAIIRLSHYNMEIVADFPRRREAVFLQHTAPDTPTTGCAGE